MMQATLMNFGDNTRVVNDMNNAAVSIGIGQIVETNIHDVHFHMIRRAVASETLLVVPKDVKQTPRLQTIMQLLRGIEAEPYDELLIQYFTVVAQGENVNLRPTRVEMRHQLRDHARQEVAIALKLQSKVNIREEGDEVTRQRDEPKQVVVPPVEPPKVKRQEGPAPITKKGGTDAVSPKLSKREFKTGAKGKSEPAPQSSKPKVKRERL